MAKTDGKLTIKDFQTGIAPSPYIGFAQMQNIDIFTVPGSLKISQILTASGNSAGVVTGLIKWFAQDPVSTDVYAVDNVGKLYKYVISTNTWSVITGHGVGGFGEGLGIWHDYLFYARSGNLDVYALPSSPNGDAGTWYLNWQNLNVPQYNTYHPILSATDDILYIGDANFVTTIEYNNGQPLPFDPGNVATFTPNLEDLELAAQYQVTCLEELGSQIAIGTCVGIDNVINIANTFFWDGTSDSFSLNNTIHFAENGVWQMKNTGNTLYTIAGTGRTRFFASTTSQAVEVKRLNNLTLGNVLNPFVGAIDQKDGEVLFGVSSLIGPNGSYPMGVYSYRDGAYVLRHTTPVGHVGVGAGIYIGAIKLYTPDRYFVSFYDESTNFYGVNFLDNTFITGYLAYVDTPLYHVGTADDPKTFERVQVYMGKVLVAGDKVRIQARKSLTGTFQIIAEFDTVAEPALIGRSSLDAKFANLDEFQDVQFKIELDTNVNSTTSPELMQVTFE